VYDIDSAEFESLYEYLTLKRTGSAAAGGGYIDEVI